MNETHLSETMFKGGPDAATSSSCQFTQLFVYKGHFCLETWCWLCISDDSNDGNDQVSNDDDDEED